MPYYEIVYETGSKSVAFYETDDEMVAAVMGQHKRAIAGLPGGPAGREGHPAERVHHVEEYKQHPDDLNPEQTMSAEVAAKEVAAIVAEAAKDSKDGVISIPALVAATRDLSSPLAVDIGPHDSMFKMAPESSLTIDEVAGLEVKATDV